MARKKTPARLQREIVKTLSDEKNRLFNALGYAGNTASQVRAIHAKLDEIAATLRAVMSGKGNI